MPGEVDLVEIVETAITRGIARPGPPMTTALAEASKLGQIGCAWRAGYSRFGDRARHVFHEVRTIWRKSL
jgi:hypothetical protein